MKRCNRCKENKNDTEFYPFTDKKCGKIYLSSICKWCDSLRKKEQRKKYFQQRNLLTNSDDQIAVCSSCEKEKKLKEFPKDSGRKNGFHNRCKICHCESRKTDKARFYVYKVNAKRRSLEFAISIEEFSSLLHQECCYCGEKNALGIDRIENDAGYVIHNCVPCCSLCNWMKKDLSSKNFVQHCKTVSQRASLNIVG